MQPFRTRIFKQCQKTTAVPGLIGTLRKNQQIDLTLEPDDEQPDIYKRTAMLEVPGILCAEYTPHGNKLIDIPSHKVSPKRFELKEVRKIFQNTF